MRFWPQVCRILMLPISAPRCFGSLASSVRVSETERKRIVQDLAVHGDQGVEFRGESEDHVEILNGQEVLPTGVDPFLFP